MFSIWLLIPCRRTIPPSFFLLSIRLLRCILVALIFDTNDRLCQMSSRSWRDLIPYCADISCDALYITNLSRTLAAFVPLVLSCRGHSSPANRAARGGTNLPIYKLVRSKLFKMKDTFLKTSADGDLIPDHEFANGISKIFGRFKSKHGDTGIVCLHRELNMTSTVGNGL